MIKTSITDIFSEIEMVRQKLKSLVEPLDEERAAAHKEGEAWSVAEVVEHISLVENGIARIVAKLIGEAKENTDLSKGTNGETYISVGIKRLFSEAENTKFTAPERVQPAQQKSIAESLMQMDESLKSLYNLRPEMEIYNTTDYKFPHPYFGELSVAEWLAVQTEHEKRHIRQIERILF